MFTIIWVEETEPQLTLPLTTPNVVTWSPTLDDSVVQPTTGDIEDLVGEHHQRTESPQHQEHVLMLEDRISRMLQQQQSHRAVEVQKRQQFEPSSRTTIEASWQRTEAGSRVTSEWRMEHMLITGGENCHIIHKSHFSVSDPLSFSYADVSHSCRLARRDTVALRKLERIQYGNFSSCRPNLSLSLSLSLTIYI